MRYVCSDRTTGICWTCFRIFGSTRNIWSRPVINTYSVTSGNDAQQWRTVLRIAAQLLFFYDLPVFFCASAEISMSWDKSKSVCCHADVQLQAQRVEWACSRSNDLGPVVQLITYFCRLEFYNHSQIIPAKRDVINMAALDWSQRLGHDCVCHSWNRLSTLLHGPVITYANVNRSRIVL